MTSRLNEQLHPVDEELLEMAALESPWHMVCSEFQERYGSPGALARRLFELESIGLLAINAKDPAATRPSVDALEADALQHGCYADLDFSAGLQCTICTTDDGFARIADRLSKE